MKARSRILLAVAVPALAVLFLGSGVFQLNCWHEEVDISSGRLRHTRYLLYCQIGERVEDTWLSRNATDAGNPPDWHRVNTFSPGVGYSPHYRYHGALAQIEVLESADNAISFEAEARHKVADAVLASWQTTGSDSDAVEYVQEVSEVALTLHDHGASVVRATDLPAE